MTVIGFAHRGAPRTRAEENTLPAFQRALSLGAQGLESDIGLTADGVPVLLHSGLSIRRDINVSQIRREALPPTIPTLEQLYERCGTQFELSLDMAHPQAADAVLRIATERGARERLWLNYWHVPQLRKWRDRWPDIHLVYPTMPILPRSVSRLLPSLSRINVDALNVHHRVCTAGLARAAHAQGLLLFAWGIRSDTSLARVLNHGVDGVHCDDVEGMVRLLPR